MRYCQRLSCDDGSESSLETGLELAGHEGVVGPRLGEEGEVEVEEGDVEDGGDGGEDGGPGGEVEQEEAVGEALVGEEAPEVLGEEEDAEEAGEDADELDTEGGGHEQRGGRQPQEPGGGEGGGGGHLESAKR